MVPNDALTNAIRSLGFTFKRQTDRMMVWKRKGSTDRIMIRRNQFHSEEYSRILLKQAGMNPLEIDRFISGVNTSCH